jgi:hypothetical protein
LATEYAGCSAHVDQDRYVEVVVPPAEREGNRLAPYVGAHPPATSALFVLGLYRLAGLRDERLSIARPAGTAATDLIAIAQTCGAWAAAPAVSPFRAGDVWIVAGPPSGFHVGVCVSDVYVTDDGTWIVDTVEGGQLEDARGWPLSASGIHAFNGADARPFVWRDGALYLGARMLLGVICADALGFPLAAEVHPPAATEADAPESPSEPLPNERPAPPPDAASVAAAKELPIAPVDPRIAVVRVRKAKRTKPSSQARS